MILQNDYATARRARTYRWKMMYFSGLYTVYPFIGCYGITGLPIFHDIGNCEEFNECLCVLINDVCKKNEGYFAGFFV